ncbi:MAG TPA: tetratricopeptide repeat protein [Casimicrobiaceae bacterium]|nr:tetratricopeptide repeat protein [Casimicrobiaceae bacterium]
MAQEAGSTAEQLRAALAQHKAGRLAEAEALYRRILEQDPANADALHLMGVVQHQQGRFPAAVETILRSIAANPDHPGGHLNLGLALQKLRRFDEALASYDRALELRPRYPEALLNRGNALRDMRRYDDALASYQRALSLRPDYVEALLNLGNTERDAGRYEQALQSFDRALSARPGYLEAHLNRGDALQELKRHEEALASYDRALALKADYAPALTNRGAVLGELRRLDAALASLDRALAIDAAHAEALNNRGAILQALLRHEDALASYDRALALKPDYARALHNRGTALAELQRYDEAARAFRRLLALDPGYDYALGNLLKCLLDCCAWDDVGTLAARAADGVRRGERIVAPFTLLAVPSTPALQLECARIHVADKYPASPGAGWSAERHGHDRIRVAYLSADFHDHATAYLAAGLFELHDRHAFEITAVSFGRASDGPMRRRLERAFDRFVDVRMLGDREVAGMLRRSEIDIAVDLKGFTAHSRPGILACRPAPVQVNYLGFPGTMGADYIDYIVADGQVIPPGDELFYAEKVVRLPDSYQVNDSRRSAADRLPARADVGLPDDGFVFCCFNRSYKITAEVFAIWMALLEKVEGSVLWLLDDNPAACANLREQAARRGVAPERLVFAPKVDLPQHLARHRLADLFLDTLPYNAHTTGSDALWAGLPLVTCAGGTFAGRVGASLLTAAGLPELVTRSLDDYRSLGIELAASPAKLAALRARLVSQRGSCPLFDTRRYCRHLESAFEQMWLRHRQGQPPAAFDVAAAMDTRAS